MGGAGSGKKQMSKKLFVGGLAWASTEEDLRQAFGAFGELHEVKIITDRDTGRSRGFGFVTYTTAESASEAMDALNGSELNGRTIRVDISEDRRGGGGGGGGRGGRGGRGGGGGGGRDRDRRW